MFSPHEYVTILDTTIFTFNKVRPCFAHVDLQVFNLDRYAESDLWHIIYGPSVPLQWLVSMCWLNIFRVSIEEDKKNIGPIMFKSLIYESLCKQNSTALILNSVILILFEIKFHFNFFIKGKKYFVYMDLSLQNTTEK